MNWAKRTEAIRGHFGFYKPFRLTDLSRTKDEPPTANHQLQTANRQPLTRIDPFTPHPNPVNREFVIE
jgi:hypothetical protein